MARAPVAFMARGKAISCTFMVIPISCTFDANNSAIAYDRDHTIIASAAGR
jgi:hypothetical protein